VRILDEYRQLKAASPDFQPARPVVFATVRPSEHCDTVPRITEDVASRCTDLFNVGYEVLLQLLHRYFAHTEETDAQLATLSSAAIALMAGVFNPLGDLITTLPVGREQPGMRAGPSFELFYENDYLMPHLEAAWALLEERLREAANFCDPIRESGDERVFAELENVRTALLGVADSLAGHFGDWAPSVASPPATATSSRCPSRSISRLTTTCARTARRSMKSSPRAACLAMAVGQRRMSSASAPGSTTARHVSVWTVPVCSRIGQRRMEPVALHTRPGTIRPAVRPADVVLASA
jgi:hypothetical protein